MDVQINNTEQNNSFFSKYFKNIIFIILLMITIIFLCILFIKYGSNNFLWETQKNKKEPDGIRTKRSIEDRIKELKESERLTLNLDLIEKMDNMEILETRLAQTENELAALKEKYKDDLKLIISQHKQEHAHKQEHVQKQERVQKQEHVQKPAVNKTENKSEPAMNTNKEKPVEENKIHFKAKTENAIEASSLQYEELASNSDLNKPILSSQDQEENETSLISLSSSDSDDNEKLETKTDKKKNNAELHSSFEIEDVTE